MKLQFTFKAKPARVKTFDTSKVSPSEIKKAGKKACGWLGNKFTRLAD